MADFLVLFSDPVSAGYRKVEALTAQHAADVMKLLNPEAHVSVVPAEQLSVIDRHQLVADWIRLTQG
ncbi:MAG: hypothetical protein RLZZ533_840 [Cyanobacteriota bacterium]|jgi:hypothetical protein